MGVCNSCNVNENKKIQCQRKQNEECESNKENITKDKSDYIISEKLTKKTDIKKEYKISSEFLGKGGSGEVLEGVDNQGKRYAIKRINKMAIKSIEGISNEAQISLALNHPNIIKCYEVYEDLKTISFVMDLVEGGDLFDFIVKGPDGKLTDIVALELIIQILKTLTYLHNEKNIAHRDIKPENFLVSIENGEPKIKLIDFGFACFINPQKKMNENLGTLTYSAPEIINRDPYTEKVDIWAAGILFFNMLTGSQPFTSNNYIPIEEQIRSKDISFETIENDRLVSFCQKLLERDPEKRYSALKALEYAEEIQSKYEIELIRKEFNRLDPNEDGFLSTNQISNAYQLRNFTFTDQLIDFSNFKALMSRIGI